MYCVVETHENGQTLCTAVPKNWILIKNHKKNLKWPNKSGTFKKLRINAVLPGEDWKEVDCKIIADELGKENILIVENFTVILFFFIFLVSFKDALAKEIYCSNFSNTDDFNNELERKKNKRKHPIAIMDFNEMIDSGTLFFFLVLKNAFKVTFWYLKCLIHSVRFVLLPV